MTSRVPATGWLYVGKWMIRLEWKPQDLWVGAFWRTEVDGYQWHNFHLWVCLLPMLPIHLIRETTVLYPPQDATQYSDRRVSQ